MDIVRNKIRFFVPGTPRTKGSTRSFMNPKTGKIVTQGASKKAKTMENRVALAASDAFIEPLTWGPVRVWIEAIFERPKAHFGTGKNSDKLKDSAPEFHIKKPDIDKIARLVLDGLTGVVFRDDSQVIDLIAWKRYVQPDLDESEREGLMISFECLT